MAFARALKGMGEKLAEQVEDCGLLSALSTVPKSSTKSQTKEDQGLLVLQENFLGIFI